MARTKPKVEVLSDLKEADAALAELAAIRRDLTALEHVMNESIDNIKAEAKAQAAPLTVRMKALETALANYATVRKTELFQKKKSVDLTFGVLGFPQASKLKTLAKWTWKLVLERLQELADCPEGKPYYEAIRVKSEVDKEKMRDWPEERLATVGVLKVAEDEFYYELKAEEIKENAA